MRIRLGFDFRFNLFEGFVSFGFFDERCGYEFIFVGTFFSFFVGVGVGVRVGGVGDESGREGCHFLRSYSIEYCTVLYCIVRGTETRTIFFWNSEGFRISLPSKTVLTLSSIATLALSKITVIIIKGDGEIVRLIDQT